MENERTTLMVDRDVSALAERCVDAELRKELKRFVDKGDFVRYLVRKFVLEENVE